MKKLLLILFCIPLFTIAQQNDLTYQQAHDITFSKKYKNFTKINSYEKSINSYQVELHKKFSIPFACIIFIVIGAPLGILSRRGGFGVSISISLLFFIIYWAFLIGGEELADRGFLHPGLSMWLPNIILGLIGLYLCHIVSTEKNVINVKN